MHSWDRTGPLVHSDHSGFLSINRWENTLDYLGSSLGPICSSFPACTPAPWTEVERRKPASFSSSPQGSPAALEHPISLNPSFFPHWVTTEEAEAYQTLPTPPKVRVLSRFHLRKGAHLFEVIYFDCEQESYLAAIPASTPCACWVNLALFSGRASVSGLIPSTCPRANPRDHTCRSDHSRDWMERAWTTQQGPGHLVLHRCQVLRQRARPHQPASLCTLNLGRGCDSKSLCKTRAILGKRLSREPWTTNVRCLRPAGVSDSSCCNVRVPQGCRGIW